jgi:SdpC family antimicrobial peptide
MSLAATGCGAANEDAQSTDEAVTRLDGAALFRGIYFGDGTVGARLPEIHAHRLAAAPAVIAARAHLVEQIASTDPRFFGSFATAITSGDHLRVKAALVAANTHVRDGLAAIAHLNASDTVAIGEAARADEIVIDTYTDSILYVYVYGPVVLGQTVHGLQDEALVQLIATRLAVH